MRLLVVWPKAPQICLSGLKVGLDESLATTPLQLSATAPLRNTAKQTSDRPVGEKTDLTIEQCLKVCLGARSSSNLLPLPLLSFLPAGVHKALESATRHGRHQVPQLPADDGVDFLGDETGEAAGVLAAASQPLSASAISNHCRWRWSREDTIPCHVSHRRARSLLHDGSAR